MLNQCGCKNYPKLYTSCNNPTKVPFCINWAQVRCSCGMQTEVRKGYAPTAILEQEVSNIWNNGMKSNIKDKR